MISSYEQLTLDYVADPGDYREPSSVIAMHEPELATEMTSELTPEQINAIDARVSQGFNYTEAAQMAGVQLPDAG